MRHLVILLLLSCSSTVHAWDRSCVSEKCRIYQYADVTLGSSSEPVRFFLEVTSSGDVILTALNTRSYHERFYTTKPPAYVRFGGRDYVPVKTFFHEKSSPGQVVVDGNRIAALPVANESQLRVRDSDAAKLVASFVSGTTATAEFPSFLYGKQKVEFSLLGFTKSYNSLSPPDTNNRSVATRSADPISVLTPLLAGNRFKVGSKDLRTKRNPGGSGMFVFAPKTRYSGTERLFIWFVKGDVVLKLNGATHNLTPSLPFPQDASLEFWEGTGLSTSTATATGLKVAFGR